MDLYVVCIFIIGLKNKVIKIILTFVFIKMKLNYYFLEASERNLIILNVELTHLGSKASIYICIKIKI